MDVQTVVGVLADETRLRCLLLLVHAEELCVCELEQALHESQPKISRHLARLRQANMVQDRRAGQWIYYRLHEQLPVWVRKMLLAVNTGAAGCEPFSSDQQRLLTVGESSTARCVGKGVAATMHGCT